MEVHIFLGGGGNRILCSQSDIASKAPYGILVLYRNDLFVSGRVHGDYIQSGAAAIQNMLLYIHSIGLGGCWICNLPDDRILRKAYAVPRNFSIIGYIIFGHPQKGMENSPEAVEYHYQNQELFNRHHRRYDLDQVMCYGKFTECENDCTQAAFPKRRQWIMTKIKLYARRFSGKRKGQRP